MKNKSKFSVKLGAKYSEKDASWGFTIGFDYDQESESRDELPVGGDVGLLEHDSDD